MKRSTLKQFIRKANKIHGNKYNYIQFQYLNRRTKGNIICPIHGTFSQTPADHLANHGCPNCGGSRQLNTEEFILKAKNIHQNKYNYNKTEYITNNTKGIIICLIHGEFNQRLANHLLGYGCPQCAKNRKLDFNEFIREANVLHHNKYDYSKFDYVNSAVKGVIICPKHNAFEQSPTVHLRGCGCPKCALNFKLSIDIFIDRSNLIHNGIYDYSKFIYINYKTKGVIICPVHGEFKQNPDSHFHGHGCPYCKNKNEYLVNKYLLKNKYNYIRQFNLINNYKCDFYILDLNLIIEYNGRQHYEICPFGGISLEKAIINFANQQKRDIFIREHCKKNNINLLEIDGRKFYGKNIKVFLDKYFCRD